VKLPTPPLLLITDRHQARLALTEIINEACAAGCRWVSVREKDLSETEQVAIFESLQPTFRKWSVRGTMHGSARTARLANADGVHLAAGSDPLAARAALGPTAVIGLSVHHLSEIKNLSPHVVDYAIAGPAYATTSKPGYGPHLGAAGIAAMSAATDTPVIAVGGITPAGVPEIMRAGASGIAVMGSVMRAAEPGREIERLLHALATAD
jgi:thiamine-phosphate pyrophosphorylase